MPLTTLAKKITPEAINNSSTDDFKAFLTDLIHNPGKYLSDSDESGQYALGKTALSECWCLSSRSHDRLQDDNTRTKVEDLIYNAAAKFNQAAQLKILSLGPGQFLQTVMLLGRLVANGHKQIDIALRAPGISDLDEDELELINNAYRQFKTMIDKMNEAYEVNITHTFKQEASPSSEDEGLYDIVYAIDYDDLSYLSDYSGKSLPGRIGKDKEYATVMALIKALSQSDSHAFLSRGKSILQFSKPAKIQLSKPEKTDFHVELLPSINEIVTNHRSYQAFYLNANIGHLIQNIDCLRKANKPLIINNKIYNPEHRRFIEQLLNQYGIKHHFLCEKDAVNYMISHGKSLVIDYTTYDASGIREKPNHGIFNSSYIDILRFDFKTRRFKLYQNESPLAFTINYQHLIFSAGVGIIVGAAIFATMLICAGPAVGVAAGAAAGVAMSTFCGGFLYFATNTRLSEATERNNGLAPELN